MILELRNGQNFWFFKDEIHSISSGEEIDTAYLAINKFNSGGLDISNTLKDVLNPNNFLKWLKSSLNNVI